MSPEARQPRHALVEARVVLHGARAERKQPGIDAVIHLAAGARSGASSRARRGPAGRSASLRSSPPRRGVKASGSSRSTPVVSAWPISKISGSICASALLPVKVGCASVPAVAGGVGGASLAVQHHRTSVKAATKAARSSSVFTSVEATSEQIVEAGAGQQARDGHAGEHAPLGETLRPPRRRALRGAR